MLCATPFCIQIKFRLFEAVDKSLSGAAVDKNGVQIIEGLYAFNEQLAGMAVYATSATTRNLQIQKQQAKES